MKLAVISRTLAHNNYIKLIAAIDYCYLNGLVTCSQLIGSLLASKPAVKGDPE